MIPNTSFHTIKVGIGLASRAARKPNWLLGPWAANPWRRLAQVLFLLGSLGGMVWFLLLIDRLFS